MKINDDQRTNDRRAEVSRKPVAIVGAGKLVASIWKSGDERAGWRYRFNIYRLSHGSGRVSQRLAPCDVADLVKLARVLASTLADDGCLDPQQREALIDLAADIDQIISPTE